MSSSEIQSFHFQGFVLIVFWGSTSYKVIIVFCMLLMKTVKAPASWWSCSFLECICGLEKTWNKLNFLRCIFGFDLVLKHCSNINEANCIQILFYFIVLMVLVGSVIRIKFYLCFRFSIDFFSYCTFMEMFAFGFRNWVDH